MISSLLRIPQRATRSERPTSPARFHPLCVSPRVCVYGRVYMSTTTTTIADSDNFCLFKPEAPAPCCMLSAATLLPLSGCNGRKLIKIMAFLRKTFDDKQMECENVKMCGNKVLFWDLVFTRGSRAGAVIYHIQMKPHAKGTKSVFGTVFENAKKVLFSLSLPRICHCRMNPISLPFQPSELIWNSFINQTFFSLFSPFRR